MVICIMIEKEAEITMDQKCYHKVDSRRKKERHWDGEYGI